jgi:hypothetical protein
MGFCALARRSPWRAPLLWALMAALAAGCAASEPTARPQGTPLFQAGRSAASQAATEPTAVPGPALAAPGLLVPLAEPQWQSGWVDQRSGQQGTTGRAAQAGLMTGMMILQAAPLVILAWPVALGVAAGILATSAGVGAASGGSSMQPGWLSPPDEAAIASATNRLQAERLARDALAEALQRRTGRPLGEVPLAEAAGAEGPGAEALAAARGLGLDGVLEVRVEGVGLAAGGDTETFGAFAQIRLRVFDVADGRLRYERVAAYGPGQPLGGLPNPDEYSLGLLAADAGRTYRHEAAQAIGRVARFLAFDPALPMAGR